MDTITIWVEVPITVNVTYYHPGSSADISGPPERCSPEEPSELDADAFMPDGTPVPQYIDALIDWDAVEREYAEKLESRREEA